MQCIVTSPIHWEGRRFEAGASLSLPLDAYERFRKHGCVITAAEHEAQAAAEAEATRYVEEAKASAELAREAMLEKARADAEAARAAVEAEAEAETAQSAGEPSEGGSRRRRGR